MRLGPQSGRPEDRPEGNSEMWGTSAVDTRKPSFLFQFTAAKYGLETEAAGIEKQRAKTIIQLWPKKVRLLASATLWSYELFVTA